MNTAIVVTTESQAVAELRSLRQRAEKTSAEIGHELLRWQQSLGRGKFKRAYHAAGWTENQSSTISTTGIKKIGMGIPIRKLLRVRRNLKKTHTTASLAEWLSLRRK